MLFHKKSIYEYLLVGLGNPGPKYAGNRHNVGFRALDCVLRMAEGQPVKAKAAARLAEVMLSGRRCLLVWPETFMNNSGEAVSALCRYYKVSPERVLVLFDDISLPVGQLRIRKKGSDGGHNGVKSLIRHLNSEDFPRIKIGVGGKPHPDYDLARWVLCDFAAAEKSVIEESLVRAAEAAGVIVMGDIDRAMNQYNTK